MFTWPGSMNVSSSHSYSAAILVTASAALLLSATYVAVVEVGPFATERLSERATVRAVADRIVAPGLSIQSQIDFLFHCRVAMTSLAGRAQPSAVREKILGTCGEGSDAIVAAAPGFSAAWYTGALVASFTGEPEKMNRWLDQSYATGPFEQWIAELRVDLVEDNFADLDADLVDRHLADLAILLSNDRGRRFLASRYLAFPQLRERIDLLLTTASEPDARRFLNIVERLRVEKERTHGR